MAMQAMMQAQLLLLVVVVEHTIEIAPAKLKITAAVESFAQAF
jgi:hypothetical protein